MSVLAFSSPAARASCPNAALGETQDDCPWGDVGRDLQTVAAAGGDIREALEKDAPSLYRQIESDASREDLKALWGRSINFDEYAHATIVDPEILDVLAKIMKTPKRNDRIVHAGMEHVYGYLFSTLQTSFGYKRARWVRDDIETGFGLERGTLGPKAESGTLFSNLTFFAGHIAFRNEPAALTVIDGARGTRSSDLQDFDFSVLKPIRLEEVVSLGDTRTVTLRTDLVPFPKGPLQNSHLLVYSVLDSDEAGPKIITAFPVAAAFVTGVVNPANLGEGKTVMTRYNGYVEGLTGHPTPGTRKIISP